MPYHHFTPLERMKLETLLRVGYTQAAIAKEMGFSPSAISREIKRNATVRGYYLAVGAQYKYLDRRKHCRPSKRLENKELRERVRECLNEEWSPEEISGTLGEVVLGRKKRADNGQITVFDSTGLGYFFYS